MQRRLLLRLSFVTALAATVVAAVGCAGSDTVGPAVASATVTLSRPRVALGSPVDIGHEVVTTLARDFERIETIEAAYDDLGRTACCAHGDVE